MISATCFGQTFMIVATEIRDGEELQRPFASQEGMIEQMFDSGFVSFDTGLYEPAVDWRAGEFEEPLAIARQGLAQYLLAAEVVSETEPRFPADKQSGTQESGREPVLKIITKVQFYLLDVRSQTLIGRGELVADNESPEKQQLTYFEFLYTVGRAITERGIECLKKSRGKF
jgi:hypothetical protein